MGDVRLVPIPDPDEKKPEIREEDVDGEIIIVGAEYCPNCGAVKKLFEDEIGEGAVTYVDGESEMGQKIDELFGGITAVPFVTFVDKTRHTITECDLAPEDEEMTAWDITCDIFDEAKTRPFPVESESWKRQ